MKKTTRYSPEVRQRAVHLFEQALQDHPSRWAATKSVAEKIGCTTEFLRRWVKQADIDQGKRDGLSTSEHEEMKAPRSNPQAIRLVSVEMKGLGDIPPAEYEQTYYDAHNGQANAA